MTAEPDLLPCPFCGSAEPIVAEHPEMLPPSFRVICSGGVCHAVVEGRTLVRAKLMWNRRANFAHATAAKDAEIEALRAEVERANGWNERVSVCRDHVADIVDGPCVICALDAAEARADKLRAEVEFLRRGIVPRDDDMIVPIKLLDEINASGAEWKDRAERLAEALRRYGAHDQACVAANIPICTCGLDAALEQEAGRG